MRALRLSPIALSLAILLSTHAVAETLGDARVGFTAERVLILDGRSFVGRMWHMPGEQRHEQDFPAIKPILILRADSTIGQVVLPQLHSVVEFVLPKAVSVLSHPDLRRPIGQVSIDGIATTQYLVEHDTPEGHATGSLWLSSNGIPMKCVGKFVTRNGKLSTIDWQLYHVKIGRQDVTLFEIPRGYTKLPLEAAAPLLRMRVAPAPAR
jgi:hypothetical protein